MTRISDNSIDPVPGEAVSPPAAGMTTAETSGATVNRFVSPSPQTEDATGAVERLLALAHMPDHATHPQPGFRPVARETLNRVPAVFVPPPGYAASVTAHTLRQRLFIICGPAHSGKFTCAVQLGIRRHSTVAQGTGSAAGDSFTRYERGLDLLLKQFPKRDPVRGKVAPLASRLRETITRSRNDDDPAAARVDRTRILGQLDRISLTELGKSFSRICTEQQMRALADLPLLTGELPLRELHLLPALLAGSVPAGSTICINAPGDVWPGEAAALFAQLGLIAANNNTCIMLTTTQPERRLRGLDLPVITTVMEETAYESFMQQVFVNHLRFYEEHGQIPAPLVALLRQEQPNLLRDALPTPRHVFRFCAELRELPPDATDNTVRELALRCGGGMPGSAAGWFRHLSDNAKLYALLVALFPGISQLALEAIYVHAVETLRRAGLTRLDDPRALGRRDIMRAVYAHNDEGCIRFDTPVFAAEVAAQIQNYQHLLWSVVSALVADLGSQVDRPDAWELRRTLGRAIGHLGVDYLHEVEPLLQSLAYHPAAGAATMVGEALDALRQAEPRATSFVFALLQRWIDSRVADLICAAGTASGIIYAGLAQETEARTAIWDLLTRFAEQFDATAGVAAGTSDALLEMTQPPDHTVMRAVAHARCLLTTLETIALHHPADVVQQMRAWLEREPGSTLHSFAVAIGRRLFAEPVAGYGHALTSYQTALLDLVEPLLTAGDAARHTVLDALLAWIEQAGWTEKVALTLLRAANRLPADAAAALRVWLTARWLDRPSEDVRRIARSILARSYALEGVPMDGSGQRYGVLVLDASATAGRNQLCWRAGRQLYERLNAQIDTYLVALGNETLLAQPDGPFLERENWSAGHTRPRLLYPPLAQLDPTDCYFVIVLTWGAILDLPDVWASAWRERLILVPVLSNLAAIAGMPTIAVTHLLLEEDLRAIEQRAQAEQTRMLASLPPDRWWNELQTLVREAVPNSQVLSTRLATWSKRLDNLASTAPPLDLARTMINATVALAASDLAQCVELLEQWLTSDQELIRRSGTMCSRALVRLYAGWQSIPPLIEYLPLFRLLLPLARQDWTSTEVVLAAARCWAAHPDWANQLIAAPEVQGGGLFALVDQAAPAQQEQLRAIIDRWEQPLPGESGAQAPVSVRDLAAHLRFRLWREHQHRLPALPAGSSYGIIVVDPAARPARSCQRLLQIASRLAQVIMTNAQQQIHLLVYRMGHDQPVTGPGERPAVATLEAAGMHNRPRLLGPILERHPVRQVRFLLLLTNDSFLDEQDWQDTRWQQCSRVYRDAILRPWSNPFPLINRQETVEAAVEYIIDQLALTPEQGV